MPPKRDAPLPIRVPVGMRERLDAAAARQGISRNALVVKSLERTLGMQREDDDLPAEAHGCRHPKVSEKKTLTANGKGVVLVRCGECGVRLR